MNTHYSQELTGGHVGGYSKRLHNPKHCVKQNKHTGSCLDEDLIRKVAKILNMDTQLPCYTLHDMICKYLKESHGCDSESCMLTMSHLLKKLGNDKKRFIESFNPVMPKDWLQKKGKTVKKNKHKKKKRAKKKKIELRPEIAEVAPEDLPGEHVDQDALLSTDDITEYLKRQENNYPGFYSYGAVPIDFSDCSVSRPLCKFDCKTHLDNNQHQIGIVFNTDPHNKPGEHWISLYMDLQGKNYEYPAVYYFDSYGRKPPSRVQELIEKAQKQADECNTSLKYFYNDNQFQKHGSQCGMYAIHFLKEMASGKSFEEYLNSDVGDELMKQLRDDFFIDPNEM
uniref:Ubiquitin-like protease family profile domain-containing protein n=1 Tax=viral metagenome TaxID=1070528 RepID=A0A6C0F722_9ZZZZ|tara:strand:- start:841 stop:1857 length:1017 start_codon:yes stop_codon:yes gene_type:complete